jgi:cephalosporin hydroxylase
MIVIDEEGGTVTVKEQSGSLRRYFLGTAEAFRIVSRAWLRAGWDSKYVYSFTWQGRPIIQLPEDIVRIQEVIYRVRPDVIIETGVAHGGSLVYYATLCKAMGTGRVIGIDVHIRPENRVAIESHALAPLITLIEGSSTDPQIVAEVSSRVCSGETAMVLLDSCHTKEHVLAELEAYASFVPKGSYMVAMDGIMGELGDAPRTQPDWSWNNPREAAVEFARKHTDFIVEEPPFLFNEGTVTERVTYWPSAFLRRIA